MTLEEVEEFSKSLGTSAWKVAVYHTSESNLE